MDSLFTHAIQFFEAWGLWLAIASLVMFVASLAAMPFIVARIPVDYFHFDHRHRIMIDGRHPLLRLVVVSIKNLFGMVLVLAGIIMLFTPGQGLLSILFGLMIMNYPGKYRLECWIISRPPVFNAVNAMRAKLGHPPLLMPPHHERESREEL